MWTRKILQGLVTSLVMASCVLPDSGPGNSKSLDDLTHASDSGGQSSLSALATGGTSGTLPEGEYTGGVASAGATTGGVSSANAATGGVVSASLASGGTPATGGACAAGSGVGGCVCDPDPGTPDAATGLVCPYSIVIDGECPTLRCAGASCEEKPLGGNFDVMPAQQRFLYAIPLTGLTPGSLIVALGAVTITEGVTVPPAGTFQLGLYSDVNGAPGDWLGNTNVLKAGPGSEGALSPPVTAGDNGKYWLMMLTGEQNQVALEKLITGTSRFVYFAQNVSCLPSPTCSGVPNLSNYFSAFDPKFAPLGFIPFLYAKYVAPQ